MNSLADNLFQISLHGKSRKKHLTLARRQRRVYTALRNHVEECEIAGCVACCLFVESKQKEEITND